MAPTDLPSPKKLPQQDPEFVRGTFASISRRYDFANHLLSAGIDFLWRRKAGKIVASVEPRRILDLATGSGDLALELERRCPSALVVGADFCLPMLQVARSKGVAHLVQADGLKLPFAEGEFDALTVAFGLRNMASWEKALNEMSRVLAPGGLLLVMDFSLPVFPPFRWVYRFYLHHILPRLAGWATGQPQAYEYLGESIEAFPRGKAMLDLIASCGFSRARRHLLAGGIASIYCAEKSGTNKVLP